MFSYYLVQVIQIFIEILTLIRLNDEYPNCVPKSKDCIIKRFFIPLYLHN